VAIVACCTVLCCAADRKHVFQLLPSEEIANPAAVVAAAAAAAADDVRLDVAARSAIQKRKWMSEIRKAQDELRNTMLNEDEVSDRRSKRLSGWDANVFKRVSRKAPVCFNSHNKTTLHTYTYTY
jgi:hypothetical protein